MPQQQTQDQQVEATIQRIDHNPQTGWYTVTTDQGEFSTKFPEPLAEAQQYLNQRATIVFQTAEPRQGRNGQWYQSRYLRRVLGSGGYQPQAQPQQVMAQSAPPQQGVSSDQRELRIMRQTAGKLAVQTMALVPSEHRGFGNQVMVAEAWVRYFVNGPEGVDAPTTMPEDAGPPSGPSDDIPW